MPRMNHTAALPPVLIMLLATACAHHRAPRGPEAEVLFRLYSGDWVLDADASDPPPAIFGSIQLDMVPAGAGHDHRGPVLGPPPCPPGRLCADRPKSSGDDESDSSDAASDSLPSSIYRRLAASRPPRLTLLFTRSVFHVSPSALGTPIELSMDAEKRAVDHDLGEVDITVWSGWRGNSPTLTISVGDEFRISDTYELAGDGSLVVTRETGGGWSFFPEETPRFVYRRP